MAFKASLNFSGKKYQVLQYADVVILNKFRGMFMCCVNRSHEDF